MRELWRMRTARSKETWEQTSLIAALLANANRKPNKPPFTPAQFNPWASRPKPVKVPISILKDVFT